MTPARLDPAPSANASAAHAVGACSLRDTALPAAPTPGGDPGEPGRLTHLLHFEPLGPGAGLDIPCDARGDVRLDALRDELRNEYFFARTLVGRVFSRPTIRPVALPADA